MIFRFSEGCLIKTDSPFELSQYAKNFTSKNRGRRYFPSQPLLALFLRLSRSHVIGESRI